MEGIWIFSLLEEGDVVGARKAIDEDPACLESRNHTHDYPLGFAVENGDALMTTLLLAKGANPDGGVRDYDTPLCRAISVQGTVWLNLACLLIAAGADVNRVGFRGTPLHRAILERSLEKIRFLILMGAEPNTRAGADGETPLWAAARVGDIEILRVLREIGADPSMRDLTCGWTPLEMVRRCFPERAEELQDLLT